jgi:hypothetical protein
MNIFGNQFQFGFGESLRESDFKTYTFSLGEGGRGRGTSRECAVGR